MKKLCIFDVDNTIIDTRACVTIYNLQTGEKKFMTPPEYNKVCHKLQGVMIDYSQFVDPKQLEQEQKTPYFFEMLKKLNNPDIDLYICTARSNRNTIMDWINTYNEYEYFSNQPKQYLDIEHVYGSKVGDIIYLPKFKTDFLDSLLSKHRYSSVEIYEDDNKIVDAFRNYLKDLDIKFKIHHVKDCWKINPM